MKPLMFTRTDRPLSARAQRFARFLFQGHTQLKSWQLAGYSTNYPEQFQRIHAQQLANSLRVKALYRLLQDQQDQAIINSPTSRRAILSKLSKEEGVPPHARISAIDVHNKMDRLYSENTINIDNRTLVIKWDGNEAKKE